jgi:CRP-like cAMP-binding protein
MYASTLLTLSGNLLLATLPERDVERLRPSFEKVSFDAADIVCDAGDFLDFVYFPTTCIVSLVYTTAGGITAEMGIVGNEGAVGIAAIMGGDTTPNRAVIQIGGSAIKIRTEVLRQEFERNLPFRRLLLLYAQALITQVSQTAVCNRFHSVEQRLCRRILLCQDRLLSDELLMTQEFIANMLGCRRQSVTVIAGHLQDVGLIQYARGRIKILDRAGLERRVCECYMVEKMELDRLLEGSH